MSVTIGILIEIRPEIIISQKIHFLIDFLVNPRPLYNSNMAKVSVVKWYQNMIFVDGNPFFCPIPDFEIALKQQFSGFWIPTKGI